MTLSSKGSGHEKRVNWLGDSLDVLKDFPKGIQMNIGVALRRLQLGETEIKVGLRKMEGKLKIAWEIREYDENRAYRCVLTTKIKGNIYVLHCFTKSGDETPQREINTAYRRYQSLV